MLALLPPTLRRSVPQETASIRLGGVLLASFNANANGSSNKGQAQQQGEKRKGGGKKGQKDGKGKKGDPVRNEER